MSSIQFKAAALLVSALLFLLLGALLGSHVLNATAFPVEALKVPAAMASFLLTTGAALGGLSLIILARRR